MTNAVLETSDVRLSTENENKCMLVLWSGGCHEVLNYQLLNLYD